MYGVCGTKSEERYFVALQVSLWAMHEEIKKKKQKRGKDQTKAFEANIKHNIHITFIWLFVLEWYPLEVKESLDHAQEQVSCKCLDSNSRPLALKPM